MGRSGEEGRRHKPKSKRKHHQPPSTITTKPGAKLPDGVQAEGEIDMCAEIQRDLDRRGEPYT